MYVIHLAIEGGLTATLTTGGVQIDLLTDPPNTFPSAIFKLSRHVDMDGRFVVVLLLLSLYQSDEEFDGTMFVLSATIVL